MDVARDHAPLTPHTSGTSMTYTLVRVCNGWTAAYPGPLGVESVVVAEDSDGAEDYRGAESLARLLQDVFLDFSQSKHLGGLVITHRPEGRG